MTVSAPNAWVGARYDECGRVLIMCESTYDMMGDDGVQMLDQDYVPAWCNHHAEPRWKDRTFNALYKACAAKGEGRMDLFNRIAFFNLWPHNLGAIASIKVKESQLREGAAMLPERLRVLAPRVVWVASATAYGTNGVVAAIKSSGARPVLSVHPVSRRNPHPDLVAAWAECRVGR